MKKTMVASCCLAVALAWVVTAQVEEPTAQLSGKASANCRYRYRAVSIH